MKKLRIVESKNNLQLQGLARAVNAFNVKGDALSQIEDLAVIHNNIKNSNIKSSDVFSLGSLIPRNGFTLKDITSGKLSKMAQNSFIDSNVAKQNINKLSVLKSVIEDLDKFYGDRSWLKKF